MSVLPVGDREGIMTSRCPSYCSVPVAQSSTVCGALILQEEWEWEAMQF
jgi:hypothetical protein